MYPLACLLRVRHQPAGMHRRGYALPKQQALALWDDDYIPRQKQLTQKISHPAPSGFASQVIIDDSHSNHHATIIPLWATPPILWMFSESTHLPPSHPIHDLARRRKKTRAALLKLGECAAATQLLWRRRGVKISDFPSKRKCFAIYNSNSPLLQQFNSQGLARQIFLRQGKLTIPESWVARSAKSRRPAHGPSVD